MKILKWTIFALACFGALTALFKILSGSASFARYGELIGDGVIIAGVLIHSMKKKG